MLVGVFIFVLSVALLVGPALFAGRIAARHFGLPGFCLFDVKPKGTLLRETAVFAVATAAPLFVCCGLIALTALVGGQSTSGNRVEVVSGGAAEVAGIANGDRIVRVDGTATPDFDAIRANIRRSQAPHSITVERDGHPLELTVTPNVQGAIGVTAIPEYRKSTIWEALVTGIRAPFHVWKSLVIPARERVELSGPVGIVKAIAHQSEPRWVMTLRSLGMLESVYCLWVPGILLNDWVNWLLFRLTQSKRLHGIGSGQPEWQMKRLRHALKTNIAIMLLFLAWLVWVDLTQGPGGRAAEVWFRSWAVALLPIVWLISRKLYSIRKSVGVTLLMLIPVANLLVILWQLDASKRWLNSSSAEYLNNSGSQGQSSS